jgi:hypothetical protein
MGAFDLMLPTNLLSFDSSTEHTSDVASIDDVDRVTDMEPGADHLVCWRNGWDSRFCYAHVSDTILFPRVHSYSNTFLFQ